MRIQFEDAHSRRPIAASIVRHSGSPEKERVRRRTDHFDIPMPSIQSTKSLAIHALQSVGLATSAFRWERPETGGFSGTELYKLVHPQRQLAIRSWPDTLESHYKLAFWDACNRACTDQRNSLHVLNSPFSNVYSWSITAQSPSLLFPFEGRLWSLCDWVDGNPICPTDVSSELITHLANVLAELHHVSRTLNCLRPTTCATPNNSTTLRERLQFLRALKPAELKLLSNHPFFEATSLRCRLTKVIEILMERMQLWHHVLEIASSQPRTCHWIVRDLWYDNILITGSRQFAAIVDLGAARYDWPGLDFIRLFGSLMAVAPVSLRHEPQEIWNTAFHAYAERYPNHLIESLEECCVLHEIATQLSIVQWMRWVYGGFFDLTNPQIANRVRNRISDLMVEEIQ